MQAVFIVLANLLPWLGSLIVNFSLSFFGSLSGSIARAIAAVAVSFSLATALVASLTYLLSLVSSYLAPPTWLVVSITFLSPPHFSTFLSIVVATKLSVRVYHFAKYNLSLAAGSGKF